MDFQSQKYQSEKQKKLYTNKAMARWRKAYVSAIPFRILPEIGSDGIIVMSNGQIGRFHRGFRGITWYKYKPRGNGYRAITIYPEKNKPKEYYVHQLVAAAFWGSRPDGHVIDHINERKDDNRAENLQYLTPSENLKKAIEQKKEKEEEV